MGVKSGAQLKCIYTNARSMGNKQDELEAIVRQDSYDVVTITETWWDDGHDWNAAMNGYKLLRRNRQRRRGGGVALNSRECFECMELDSSDDEVECSWVRMKGKANKGDFILCWESAIDHPTRMSRLMKYSISGWLKSRNRQPLFWLETSTYQISAGNITQQRAGRLGGSSSVWKITS
ncbi:nipped-b-like protein [Limosa lapponica baueri]|uniref:Nipped-b-like protein n=1 Tax=Limosa lapponica baueri TaxID=1758121 RepID=A0A2I0T3X7_LIMLA|nr:nipped-b-like protein [Limosa lapponica baueri]